MDNKAIRTEVKRVVDKNKGVRRASALLGLSKEAIRSIMAGDFSRITEQDVEKIRTRTHEQAGEL